MCYKTITRLSVEGQRVLQENLYLGKQALYVGQVKDNEIAGSNASISALEFSSTSLTLVIGNNFGLVRIKTLFNI